MLFLEEECETTPTLPKLDYAPENLPQTLYLSTCKRLSIPISTQFYKQLTKDKIILRGRGLGPLGVKACATALTVCRRVLLIICNYYL